MVELILRQDYRATDGSAASAAMQAVFGVGTASTDGPGTLLYQQQSIVDDGVSATRVTSSGTWLATAAPAAPDLVVLAVRSGGLEVDHGDGPVGLAAGQLGLIPLGSAVDLRWHDVTFDAFSFPPASVGRLLGAHVRLPHLHIGRLIAERSTLTRLWTSTSRTLVAEVLQDHDLYQSDIIREQAIDALLAIAIEAFGLSDRAEDGAAVGEDVRRRAETYMRAHLADPISIPDVARAVGISVRGLQLAYSTAGQGTALLHLRQVRMEAARAALIGSTDPALTVSAVARSLGYTNFGRFTAHYRAAYGQSPVETRRSASDGGPARQDHATARP